VAGGLRLFRAGESHNIQMRYNISERDGKKLAWHLGFRGVSRRSFTTTSFITSRTDQPARTCSTAKVAVVTTSIFGKSGKPDLRVYNNIFITNGRTNSAATSNNLCQMERAHSLREQCLVARRRWRSVSMGEHGDHVLERLAGQWI